MAPSTPILDVPHGEPQLEHAGEPERDVCDPGDTHRVVPGRRRGRRDESAGDARDHGRRFLVVGDAEFSNHRAGRLGGLLGGGRSAEWIHWRGELRHHRSACRLHRVVQSGFGDRLRLDDTGHFDQYVDPVGHLSAAITEPAAVTDRQRDAGRQWRLQISAAPQARQYPAATYRSRSRQWLLRGGAVFDERLAKFATGKFNPTSIVSGNTVFSVGTNKKVARAHT